MENLIHLPLCCDLHRWTQSIFCCGLVSLAGVLPYFVFNSPKVKAKEQKVSPIISSKNLDYLLNFAIGSLLGDTFLHLLPETWERSRKFGNSHDNTGIWILVGIISFVICEKLAAFGEDEEPPSSTNNNVSKSGNENDTIKPCQKDVISGYFNLIANGFDNFTHGLAVGGSFLISTKIGYLTTIAILLHEIPHEISDFAILLRSGFNPLSAVKAQLWTSCFGFLGAICALIPKEFEDGEGFIYTTNWILPFTSGCFISIALINLLPEQLTKDGETGKDSLKQLLFLLLGITVMGVVSMCHV